MKNWYHKLYLVYHVRCNSISKYRAIFCNFAIFFILRKCRFEYLPERVQSTFWCQNLRLVNTQLLTPSNALYSLRKVLKLPIFYFQSEIFFQFCDFFILRKWRFRYLPVRLQNTAWCQNLRLVKEQLLAPSSAL